MNNTNNLLKDNAGHILLTLFSIITVASLSLISNSYAASTNTDLNNVFGCITQKANERSDLTLSDAFVCYDHNLKGASKFANQPFQNPDLSNLEAKPSTSSDKAADKSTTPDSISAATDSKAGGKGATKANDVLEAKDNQGTSDTTAKDKKDKSKPATDPFATQATDSTSKPTTTTKTSSKDKPDINPSSRDFQSFDLPFSVIMPT
jgi:hypothetical protein